MPVIAEKTDALSDYLTAWEVLTFLREQLENPARWDADAHLPTLPPDRLDDVVATLCRQARAAQQLAVASESLCAALVGESHYRPA